MTERKKSQQTKVSQTVNSQNATQTYNKLAGHRQIQHPTQINSNNAEDGIIFTCESSYCFSAS